MRRLLLLVVLPVLAIAVAGALLMIVSGRTAVDSALARAGDAADVQPLFARLHGYDSAAVARHWTLIGPALTAERRFLQADLAYPVFIALVLAAALRHGAGTWHPVRRAGYAALALFVLADLGENGLQLAQLEHFLAAGATGLDGATIALASVATRLKLVMLAVAAALLLVVALRPARAPG